MTTQQAASPVGAVAAVVPPVAAPVPNVRVSPWLRALRPRQWTKSALVLAAPMAAGEWDSPHTMAHAGLAVAAFTAAAAGVYLVNDVFDMSRDRLHPRKRSRPVASGQLAPRAALAIGTGLMATATGVAAGAGDWALGVVLAGYLVVSLTYSAGLKRVAVLELALVSLGFVLRPLAGAAATGIPPSGWFLAVCCLGALTVAAGKRLDETRLGPAAVGHRQSLRGYSAGRLAQLRSVAAAGMLLCYLAWAVTRPRSVLVLAVCSLVPLAVGCVRYLRCNDRGDGGAPEDLVFRDRPLQLAGLVWLVLFLAGPGHA